MKKLSAPLSSPRAVLNNNLPFLVSLLVYLSLYDDLSSPGSGSKPTRSRIYPKNVKILYKNLSFSHLISLFFVVI
ncbi:Uncharacterised protein [Acetobacterium wieringae]|jgi:hypothetical protein|nr:Uncharacterised protein [Acetobacterium wieringae]